jgi:hypothetical protein
MEEKLPELIFNDLPEAVSTVTEILSVLEVLFVSDDQQI